MKNYSYLYDLAYNREYEKLVEMLENKKRTNKLERIENVTLKLARVVVSDKIKDVKDTTVKNPFGSFRDFYDAVNDKNYRLAYDQIKKISNRTNDTEVSTYKLILEDIVDRLLKGDFVKDVSDEQRYYEENIARLLRFKEFLTEEEIVEIEKYLFKEIDLLYENENDPYYLNIIADLLDMIRTSNIFYMDENYFEIMDYTNMNSEEVLISSLNNGDYVTSYKTILGNSFKLSFKSIPYNYLVTIKRLLMILKNNLNLVKKVVKKTDLVDLRLLVEEDKYKEAINCYLENINEIEDNNLEIISNLLILNQEQKKLSK